MSPCCSEGLWSLAEVMASPRVREDLGEELCMGPDERTSSTPCDSLAGPYLTHTLRDPCSWWQLIPG